ncbi:MAG: cupin domain-containing protein [Verrucomicrobiota bacterium]
MKFVPMLIACCAVLASCVTNPKKKSADPAAAGDNSGLIIDTLMRSDLTDIDGREIVIHKVYIPPNTELPKHWHPSEEFAYVLEGTTTLWQKGKRNLVAKKGDVVKIPIRQIHTGITGDEGASIIVFRVHEKGEPERVLVD